MRSLVIQCGMAYFTNTLTPSWTYAPPPATKARKHPSAKATSANNATSIFNIVITPVHGLRPLRVHVVGEGGDVEFLFCLLVSPLLVAEARTGEFLVVALEHHLAELTAAIRAERLQAPVGFQHVPLLSGCRFVLRFHRS